MIHQATFLLGLIALGLSARSAPVSCDALIFDNASVLSPADRERIEAASQPLKQQGADVHIFIFQDGKPAEAVREAIAACSGWQTWDGEANDNLILLAISPKSQESSLLYGPGWRTALDGHWTAIRKTHLVPPVRNGRWAEGFVETERALRVQVRAYQKRTEQKSRQHKRWLSWGGSFLGMIFAVLFVRQWRKAYRTQKAEALVHAELQDAFRAWLEDELLKVNIQTLGNGSEPLQRLHRTLEEAKHAIYSHEEAERQWKELKRMLGSQEQTR